MLCLGSRKKAASKLSGEKSSDTLARSMGACRPASVASSRTAVSQIRQEYNALKSKNSQHLDVIARQSVELEQLRHKLDESQRKNSSSVSVGVGVGVGIGINTITEPSAESIANSRVLADLEARNKEIMDTLALKEQILQQKEAEIETLLERIEEEDHNQGQDTDSDSDSDSDLDKGPSEEEQKSGLLEKKLAEKDSLLRDKERQLEDWQKQWQSERAELVKPALQEVTFQLNQLKKTNEEAVSRLEEKENELAELRAQLNRRDRKPKEGSQDQERQKRVNRLTMDLESDRMLIQKLDELNHQLEAQKQKHEAILQVHAEAMAEKDRVLVQHQKTLQEIKTSHSHAINSLEREQKNTIASLEKRHATDLAQLRERLSSTEKHAKNNMNDEVEKLLQEFEQSEHNHSVQLAHLQKSHQEQVSSLKQDQQAELRDLLDVPNANTNSSHSHSHSHHHNSKLNDSRSNEKSNERERDEPVRKPVVTSKLKWPGMLQKEVPLNLTPRDPALVQVYVSSVSTNSTIKRNQEVLQTMLTSNHIQYEVMDVAQSEQALQHMRRQSSVVGGRVKPLPQVFVGGDYRGQLEDVTRAVDDNQLSQLLRPRTRDIGRTKIATPVATASTIGLVSPPKTPVPRSAERSKTLIDEDDDALLKAIELELGDTDFSTLDLNF
ncbi:hypothetical protein J3Q64DRAFT_1773493 [Phycomyces blakesleeanus]